MRSGKSCLLVHLNVCFFALVLSFSFGNAQAQTTDACGPSPAVKTALDRLPQQAPAQSDWQYHEQHVAAIRALMRRYPDDMFLQETYIRSMFNEREKVLAEYKARYEQNPASAPLAYLYGMTLLGWQTSEAVKQFNKALREDPRLVRANEQLAIIYSFPAFANKEQMVTHLKAFLDACPASYDGYAVLSIIGDQDMLRPYAAKLRAQIENRSDPEAVDAYRALWPLEFKSHSASDYDGLRQQVRKDLKRLRSLNLKDHPEWYYALESGYKLVNDKKQAAWVREQRQERFPMPWEAPPEVAKWSKAHHAPAKDAPLSAKSAYYKDLLAQTGQWLKARPYSNFLWGKRLDAMQHLDDLPEADLVAAIGQRLKVAASNAGPKGAGSNTFASAVEILLRKHFAPDRVVEWARQGLAEWESESKVPLSDLNPKDIQDDIAADRASLRLRLLRDEIKGYLQLKQADNAEERLAQMEQWLGDFKSLSSKQSSSDAEYARYWELRASEADLGGHKLDAMAYYEEALLTRPAASQEAKSGEKDELADNAHRLWKDLGGTEEAWQIWYGHRANELKNQVPLTWEEVHEPLPAFQLADLSGKTWNLAALRGKITLVTFWSSW